MAKGVGRPAKKTGAAAAKQRAASRKSYQSKSVAERKAVVQTRDKEAQRKADAKRLASQRPQRNKYHREQAAAVSKVSPGGKCSVCGTTKDVERHHVGGKVVKLCGICHAKARGWKR